MIRDAIKRHMRDNSRLLWLVMLFTCVFFFFGYKGYKSEVKYDNLSHEIYSVEIGFFELIAITKRMILELDEAMIARISKKKAIVSKHLTLLKQHNELYEESSNSPFHLLEKEVEKTFIVIDTLVSIERQKKYLFSDIQDRIRKIDKLLKPLEDNSHHDTKSALMLYRFDLGLSKLARELGVYLKTSDKKALQSIALLLSELDRQKSALSSMKLAAHTKVLYSEILLYANEKNSKIKKIVALHTKKTDTLKQLGVSTDRVNHLIDENLHNLLLLERIHVTRVYMYLILAFFVLLVLLIVFFLRIKQFLSLLSSVLEDGFDRLLESTRKISRNIVLQSPFSSENQNEFQLIGASMMKMQSDLFRLNFSNEELENLLESIGELRCVVHSDESITFPSDSIYEISQWSRELPLDTSLFGNCFSFSALKSLVRHALIHELPWHIVDAEGSYRQIQLSAMQLSETSLFLFGTRGSLDGGSAPEFPNSVSGLVLLDAHGRLCDHNIMFAPSVPMDGSELMDILLSEYRVDGSVDMEQIKKLANTAEEIVIASDAAAGYWGNAPLFMRVYELYTTYSRQPAYALKIYSADIKDIKHKVSHLTRYDPLTGIPNRASLFRKINHKIKEEEEAFSLLLIRISELGEIKERYGYRMEDQVLVYVARVMKEVFSDTEDVYHLREDEFCILCKCRREEMQKDLSVSQLLERFNKPVTVDTQSLVLSIEIGIACYPEDGQSSKSLLHVASAALMKFNE